MNKLPCLQYQNLKTPYTNWIIYIIYVFMNKNKNPFWLSLKSWDLSWVIHFWDNPNTHDRYITKDFQRLYMGK